MSVGGFFFNNFFTEIILCLDKNILFLKKYFNIHLKNFQQPLSGFFYKFSEKKFYFLLHFQKSLLSSLVAEIIFMMFYQITNLKNLAEYHHR